MFNQVDRSVVALAGKGGSTLTHFKISRQIVPPNYFTSTPCGVCPVISQCCEGGNISPSSCEYMKAWLEMPNESDELF